MLNQPYTKSDRIYANDLKVFIGKRGEIADLEARNKLVDKKWYLAWDTGEFFVANAMRKLVRYGGSAKTLSPEEIQKLIDNYTKQDLEIIRAQLVESLNRYNTISRDVQTLTDKVNSMEEHTEAYLIKKIDELLTSEMLLNFTYSKNEIDNKIQTSHNDIINTSANTFATKEELTHYSTTDEINRTLSSKVSYADGNTIIAENNAKKTGIYLCISTSNDSLVQKGHTYDLHNGTINDITIIGSSNNATNLCEIELLADGNKFLDIEAFSSIHKNVLFSYTITKPLNMKSNDLILYEKQEGKEPIEFSRIEYHQQDSGSVSLPIDLDDIGVGQITYSLVGVDNNDNIIKGEYVINSIAPIYYGSSHLLIPDADDFISANKKLSNNISGTYTFNNNNGEYLWIAVSSTNNIRKIELNGFTVPFALVSETELLFKENCSLQYKIYRTEEAINAGIWNLNIQ